MPDDKTIEKPKQPVWLVYVSLFVAGILLLGDAFGWSYLYGPTARLGVALVFSAVALFIDFAYQLLKFSDMHLRSWNALYRVLTLTGELLSHQESRELC